MIIFTSCLVSYLLLSQVFRPILENIERKKLEYEKLWEKIYKIRLVRGFYPQFKEVSYDELERKYGVDNIFQTIGQSQLKGPNRKQYFDPENFSL